MSLCPSWVWTKTTRVCVRRLAAAGSCQCQLGQVAHEIIISKERMSEPDNNNLSASYHRATDEETGETRDTAALLARTRDSSIRGRVTATSADININAYQLSKLKFVARSLFPKHEAAIDKADDTASVYAQLKLKYGGDSEKADSVLKVILCASGVNTSHSESGTLLSLSEIDDDCDEVFQWRTSLIECSDKAVKRRSVPQLVDHVYDVYSIDKTKEHFSSMESPLPLFDHMIEQKILQRGREEDLKKIEKFFHFWKWSNIVKISLVLACVVLLLMAVTSLLLLLRYASNLNNISHSKDIYYLNSTTGRAVEEEFDLRLHDKFQVEVSKTTTDYQGEQTLPYSVCVCQAKCDSTMVKNPVNCEKVFDNDQSGPGARHIFDRYMVSGSEITITIRPPVVSDAILNISLNIFTNGDKCRTFSELNGNYDESFYPDYSLVQLNETNRYQYTLKPADDGYICVALKVSHAGHYQYSVSGTVVAYRDVSYLVENSLCDRHDCGDCQTGVSPCVIENSLNRPSSSLIAAQPQPTCMYFTVSNTSRKLQLTVSTTVFATSQNINVITPPAVAGTLVLLACVLVVFLCVLSCKR